MTTENEVCRVMVMSWDPGYCLLQTKSIKATFGEKEDHPPKAL
jgi:hypothetical protein